MDPERRGAKDKKGIHGMINAINTQDLLQNVEQVGFASTIISVLNIVFQIIISRTLGPEGYGEIETLLTINSIILVALAAIALIVTRFISFYKTREQYDKMRFLANWAFTFFFLMGMAFFVITVLCSRIIAEFLNIPDYQVIIVFGLLIWISFMVPIIEGILRGLQNFKQWGVYKVTEATLRVALAILALIIGLRIRSILLAMTVGSLFAIFLSIKVLRSHYIAKASRFDLQEIYAFIFPVFVACLFIALLSNMDLILVKHIFTAQEAGFFAAAGMIAKIVFGIAFAVGTVMFPKIIADYGNGDNRAALAVFRNSLKVVVLSAGAITLAVAVFHKEVTHLMFGSAYAVMANLGVYALALFLLATVSVYMMYDLAVKKYWFIAVFLIAAIVEASLILLFATSAQYVIWTLFGTNLVLLLFMIAYNWKETFKKV